MSLSSLFYSKTIVFKKYQSVPCHFLEMAPAFQHTASVPGLSSFPSFYSVVRVKLYGKTIALLRNMRVLLAMH